MEKKQTDNQQEIKQLIQFNPRKHLQREISLDKFSFVFFLFFFFKIEARFAIPNEFSKYKCHKTFQNNNLAYWSVSLQGIFLKKIQCKFLQDHLRYK